MNTISAASVATSTGEVVALQGMTISGVIDGAIGVFELNQRYLNAESANIEIIYSFPLPFAATLLDLHATLNGKRYQGRVLERNAAESGYEEAITDGDSALMLSQNEPGMYTLHAGNLLAGESLEVSLKFALPLSWSDDELRLCLPTTIAPRFGDAKVANHEPHEAPTHSIFAEYPFSLELNIATANIDDVTSPTHRIKAHSTSENRCITLADEREFADRDFILSIARTPMANPSDAQIYTTESGEVVHAQFQLPEAEETKPLTLKVLVDCSGSMTGASMDIARASVEAALRNLKEADRYTLTAFGTSHSHFDKGSLQSGGLRNNLVSYWIEQLDSNYGGTELGSALAEVYSLGANSESTDVLLITDGQVWDAQSIAKHALARGHRIFVIGVGMSPAESTVRQVADLSGGAAEFVAPEEDVAATVIRQIRRVRGRALENISLSAPGVKRFVAEPALDRCYPGDTVHIWADSELEQSPKTWSLSTRTASLSALPAPARSIIDGQTMRRLVAAAQLRESLYLEGDLDVECITDMAVKWQLITPHTNYLLTIERECPPDELPEIRVQPQMVSVLAESYGRSSEVLMCKSGVREYLDMPAFLRRQAEPESYADDDDVPFDFENNSNRATWKNSLIPKSQQALFSPSNNPKNAGEFIEMLNSMTGLLKGRIDLPMHLKGGDGLLDFGVPVDWQDYLISLEDDGYSSDHICAAFWSALMLSAEFSKAKRGVLRAVLHLTKAQGAPANLVAEIRIGIFGELPMSAGEGDSEHQISLI